MSTTFTLLHRLPMILSLVALAAMTIGFAPVHASDDANTLMVEIRAFSDAACTTWPMSITRASSFLPVITKDPKTGKNEVCAWPPHCLADPKRKGVFMTKACLYDASAPVNGSAVVDTNTNTGKTASSSSSPSKLTFVMEIVPSTTSSDDDDNDATNTGKLCPRTSMNDMLTEEDGLKSLTSGQAKASIFAADDQCRTFLMEGGDGKAGTYRATCSSDGVVSITRCTTDNCKGSAKECTTVATDKSDECTASGAILRCIKGAGASNTKAQAGSQGSNTAQEANVSTTAPDASDSGDTEKKNNNAEEEEYDPSRDLFYFGTGVPRVRVGSLPWAVAVFVGLSLV